MALTRQKHVSRFIFYQRNKVTSQHKDMKTKNKDLTR